MSNTLKSRSLLTDVGHLQAQGKIVKAEHTLHSAEVTAQVEQAEALTAIAEELRLIRRLQ